MSDPQVPGSDDGGVRPDPPESAAPRQAAGDRLVLTAALRVPGDADADQPARLPDADALRALVRSILNEELDGAFGTRITRGVRRLARAEVRAEMAARRAAFPPAEDA